MEVPEPAWIFLTVLHFLLFLALLYITKEEFLNRYLFRKELYKIEYPLFLLYVTSVILYTQQNGAYKYILYILYLCDVVFIILQTYSLSEVIGVVIYVFRFTCALVMFVTVVTGYDTFEKWFQVLAFIYIILYVLAYTFIVPLVQFTTCMVKLQVDTMKYNREQERAQVHAVVSQL